MRIGEISGGSMRLLVDRPGAVMAWGLIFLIGVIGITFFQRLVAMPLLASDTPSIALGLGLDLAQRLLSMLVFALVGTAIFRAVIWREDSAWFSLRVGRDEVRIYGMLLVLALIQLVGGFVLGLLLGLASSAASLISFGNEDVAQALQLALILATLALLTWFLVRISPALPLTLVRGRISIDDAWELSRGRFWMLFLGYLLVALAAFAIGAVILAPFFGELFMHLVAAGGDPQLMRYAMANFAYRQLNTPVPILIGEGLALWLAFSLLYILTTAAVGVATRMLLVERGELEADDLF